MKRESKAFVAVRERAGKDAGPFLHMCGNSKISIKSLFLDKNKKSGDNKRKRKKIRDMDSYAIVKPFANVHI